MNNRRHSRHFVSIIVAVALLAVTLTVGAVIFRPDTSQAADSNATPPPAAPGRTLTLITGDRVTVTGAEGNQTVVFTPAGNRPAQGYVSRTIDGRLHVIPNDVLPLVPRVLDPALFDITLQLEQMGDDKARKTVPVIVKGAQTADSVKETLDAAVGKPQTLPSVKAQAVEVSKSETAPIGAELAQAADVVREKPLTDPAKSPQLPQKLWLDQKIKAVALDHSTEQVAAPAAWAKGYRGKGAVIAIMDTGIDDTHPDLKGKVKAAKNFTTSPNVQDGYGHGTHVASIAAGSGAASNGQRKGVAYEAQLLNAKMIGDDGFGSMSDAIAALEWSASQGADIANASYRFPTGLGGADPISLAVDDITKRTGMLVVAAAGNTYDRAGMGTPAVAKSALTVGAVDSNDVIADFSTYGTPGQGIKPEMVAPGVNTMAACASSLPCEGPYIPFSGTSMAAPHVAGAAALVKLAHKNWTPNQVRAALYSSADNVAGASVYDQGGGRLNVTKALQQTVIPVSGPIDFGEFIEDKPTGTRSAEVTWQNTNSADVTIDLAVTSSVIKPAQVSVTPQRLTIKAGQTAKATLRVDVAAFDHDGVFDGELTASAAAGSKVVDAADGVPFAAERARDMKTLTIKAIDKEGKPLQWGAWLTMFDVNHMKRGFRQDYFTWDENGQTTITVPTGVYHFDAMLPTISHRDEPSYNAWIVKPQVAINSDTTLVFDARTARPLQPTVEKNQTEMESLQVAEKRTDAHGSIFQQQLVFSDKFYQLAVAPTEPVTLGGLRSFVTARVRTPLITFADSALSGVTPTPAMFAADFVGTSTLPVRNVGTGTAQDFAKTSVSGALVVVRRSELNPTEVVARAVAAGAKMVMYVNDTDQPWRLAFWDRGEPFTLPVLTIPANAGKIVATRSSIKISGLGVPAKIFNSMRTFDKTMPSNYQLSLADQRQMALVTEGIANVVHGGPGTVFANHGRSPIVPEFNLAAVYTVPRKPGYRWTEYIQPGRWVATASWGQTSEEGGDFVELQAPVREEKAGSYRIETWFGQPWHPSVRQWGDYSSFSHTPSAWREKDTMRFEVTPIADGDGHIPSPNNRSAHIPTSYTMLRNGVNLGVKDDPTVIYPVAKEEANYEVRLRSNSAGWPDSTGGAPYDTTTVWTFRTAPTGDDSRKPLPLLEPSITLPLDLNNQVWSGFFTAGITTPFADQSGARDKLTSLTVDASTDSGKTWVAARTLTISDSRVLGALPKLPEKAKVSLRVTARTADGRSVTQTMINPVTFRTQG